MKDVFEFAGFVFGLTGLIYLLILAAALGDKL